ncbi:MAG: glycosyltransferase family 2 protein, partial [Cyanobacteria bacterium P01_H01_bin.121]
MGLTICAIICTHNRDRYLGAAIDSLLNQDLANYEVLVIDNASTDTTKAVVEARLQDTRLRYVYESTLGLSSARNRGFQESQADILAYLDDDAEASVGWLRSLVEAYQAQEKLAIAGGKVTLIWPEGSQVPNWLNENLMQPLGLYDLGDRPVNIINPGQTPRGLNYSIRRRFLEVIGGFDPNLGRVGKKLLSNEELFMTEAALKEGYEVAYLPEAVVAHNVAPERLKASWFIKRGWWQGVSEAYRDELAQRSLLTKLGRGGERFVRGSYKTLLNIGNPAQRFDNFVYTYGQLGYLLTALQGTKS